MTGDKRKGAPDAGGADQQNSKKKKTGNSGKWKTAHHQAKQLDFLQPGDQGIWVTCARHQELKASREISMLFSDYLEKMYGIKEKEAAGSEDGDAEDIEAAIQREVAAINAKPKTGSDDEDQYFVPIKMNVDCLLFFRTKAPIEPVEFVRRICTDAKAREPGLFKCRYVNRFTPVTVIGKASETGLLDVARKALAPYFKLKPPAETQTATKEEGENSNAERSEEKESGKTAGAPDAGEIKPSTFAIRPQIRNHSNLKRDFVITQTAALVDQEMHKVNLKSPDKVILIDIYQTICSMGVVGTDWDELKRYNLSELYGVSTKSAAQAAS